MAGTRGAPKLGLTTSKRLRGSVTLSGALLVFPFSFVTVAASHAHVSRYRPPRPNQIVVENARAGSPTWVGPEASTPAIDGYSSDASVAPGGGRSTPREYSAGGALSNR